MKDKEKHTMLLRVENKLHETVKQVADREQRSVTFTYQELVRAGLRAIGVQQDQETTGGQK